MLYSKGPSTVKHLHPPTHIDQIVAIKHSIFFGFIYSIVNLWLWGTGCLVLMLLLVSTFCTVLSNTLLSFRMVCLLRLLSHRWLFYVFFVTLTRLSTRHAVVYGGPRALVRRLYRQHCTAQANDYERRRWRRAQSTSAAHTSLTDRLWKRSSEHRQVLSLRSFLLYTSPLLEHSSTVFKEIPLLAFEFAILDCAI